MNKASKHLLIISYYYPPIAHIASDRIAAMVKYLSREPYRISVLCSGDGDERDEELRILRVPAGGLLDRASFHGDESWMLHKGKAAKNRVLMAMGNNEYQSWTKKALSKALALCKEEAPDIILSSYAPLASHHIGMAIKERFPKARWVLDMRDEMSCNPYLNTERRKRLLKEEKRFAPKADGIISVSQPILNQFRGNMGQEIPALLMCNGYDHGINPSEDYAEKFVIRYFGSFYGPIKADHFLKALLKLKEQESPILDNLEVELYTNVNMVQCPAELQSHVRVMPKVSKERAIELMWRSEALLLIHPIGERKGVYTGKLFEYLAARRPILACVDPNDVAAELIEEAEAGEVCPENDVELIVESIIRLYEAWKQKARRLAKTPIIQEYSRANQIEKLASFLEEIQ